MRRKALAVLRRSAQSVALGGIFVAAAAGGLVLHADLPLTRRLVASFANQALADVFRGRIVIGNLNELSLGATGHVHVAQVEILDPDDRVMGVFERTPLSALTKKTLWIKTKGGRKLLLLLAHQVLRLLHQLFGLPSQFFALRSNVLPSLVGFLGDQLPCLFAGARCEQQRHCCADTESGEKEGEL